MKKVKSVDSKTFNWNPNTRQFAQGVSTYNARTRAFESAPVGSVPRYNPTAQQFQLARPTEVRQFNPNTKQFEFGTGSRVWNPYTKQFETRRG
jgi:hypothetical protein